MRQSINEFIMNNKNKWLIGIGSLLAAAAAFFLIKKNKPNNEEKPPKGAPQLDIENPGSQDDFPKPPMESEIG
jgi:LPXTG-motif cell wall-anchored protein